MTVGSLFSGIGGLDWGFVQAGFEIEYMCEKDEFCREVLNERFHVDRIYEDVQDLTDPPETDLIIGGFPCQDISYANPQGEGLDGDRSGLWWEMFRIIKNVQPKYTVIENVPALRRKGLRAVLRSLAEIGYDAEWRHLKASDFGARHRRERLFIVAYPHGQGPQGHGESDDSGSIFFKEPSSVRDSGTTTRNWAARASTQKRGRSIWSTEPDVERMVHGIPNRVDRIRGLGNAVVPQMAEYIGKLIRYQRYGTSD